MASLPAAPQSVTGIASAEVSEIWLGHLASFCIPLTALAYVWTGPHVWYLAPLFMVPLAIFQWLDTRPRVERSQPLEALPAWPFDLLVYALTALHFTILWLLCDMFREHAVFSLDMLMVFLLVGGNSGFSIITAHELIHRRSRTEQLLGRALLCSVMYEQYRKAHGKFPDESTADQFFDEVQLESYRELGYQIVNEMMKDNIAADRIRKAAGASSNI